MTEIREQKQVERVMVDLETVGRSAGCGILTIGACTFDRKHVFYERILPESFRPYLFEDIETMRWWNKQDPKMREEAFGGTKDLVQVLDNFHDWFRSLNNKDYKNTELWGNGSDFDNVILAAAYKAVDRPIPWEFWNNRCYRTLKNLLPHVKIPRATQSHHALLDAEYQAEHASVLLATI